MNGEEREKLTNYTYAKVLARANEVDKNAGVFDFNAKYKIDFGSQNDYKTVSVLDIYSYREDEMGNPVADVPVEEVDVAVEKRKITKALTLAKKLSLLSERQKVLRRIFLHWLRCKNSSVADELTAFIESEVTRLDILRGQDTTNFTSYWRTFGYREKIIYNSYSHWRSFGSHYNASEFVSPNKGEAKRWIAQSQADLDVATNMLISKSYSQVCFMSQQCVEKVLKGVLYALCGIPRQELHTHEIHRLASSVGRLSGAPSEVDRAGKVANYYLPTRYPDNQPFPKVPAEEYSENEAQEALAVAETVYKALKEFVKL